MSNITSSSRFAAPPSSSENGTEMLPIPSQHAATEGRTAVATSGVLGCLPKCGGRSAGETEMRARLAPRVQSQKKCLKLRQYANSVLDKARDVILCRDSSGNDESNFVERRDPQLLQISAPNLGPGPDTQELWADQAAAVYRAMVQLSNETSHDPGMESHEDANTLSSTDASAENEDIRGIDEIIRDYLNDDAYGEAPIDAARHLHLSSLPSRSAEVGGVTAFGHVDASFGPASDSGESGLTKEVDIAIALQQFPYTYFA
jgi:hypothetical protein